MRRSGQIVNGIHAEWADNPTRLRILIPDTGTHPPGMTLPRRVWVRLNRLRTGVGRFRSCLYNWGMASSVACECGAEEQTVDHVVLQCPIHRPPHGLLGLTVLDDETIEWLLNNCPEILRGQAVNKRRTRSKEEESNQKVLFYTTHIKKVIAKLYSFNLGSKMTDKL